MRCDRNCPVRTGWPSPSLRPASATAPALSPAALEVLLHHAVSQSVARADIVQIRLLDFSILYNPSHSAPVPDPYPQTATTQLRILIVDDEPIVRTLLETWLKV